AEAWGPARPDAQTGKSLIEILEDCRAEKIKALYVVGENPLSTLPKSFGVEEALSQLELLICQDPFLTETARYAHVVFPACTFAEKDGTVTNQEGMVQFVRPALDPLGESALDWHIMVGLANGMGHALPYETTQDIQAEIRKLHPGYYNLGQPHPVVADPSAYLRNGYANSVGARYAANGHVRGPGRPYGLKLIQLIYHSGKLSTKASGLMDISPNTGALRMSLEDCERLALTDGGRVRVTSDQGSLELGVQADANMLPGTCAFPEHFNDPPVKDLVRVVVDPVTRVPYFKSAQVTIEKL
ncbi:MAG: molybdopterin-dependent oxidoreductase, partial [Nitrospira sp.]|nr:molybdopterin-dependent oxidoreductase [Nitrospira sp.]